jgi:hypothetical protein
MQTPVLSLQFPRQQRGVVMFLALIVLVILLIGGIAVARSINNSLMGAGNLAFQRDLTVRGDVVIAEAIKVLSTAGNASSGGSATGGGMSGSGIADLKQSQPKANYSAVMLEANAQGIPKALLGSDTTFAVVGQKTDLDAGGKVTIRYLIERMCNQEGPVNAAHCVQAAGGATSSGSGSNTGQPGPASRSVGVIYRVSARVTGPRDTQAFFQATFAGPG